MALATLFVTMPFVARELIPILEAMDMAQEEAARTLGASDFEVRRAPESGVVRHAQHTCAVPSLGSGFQGAQAGIWQGLPVIRGLGRRICTEYVRRTVAALSALGARSCERSTTCLRSLCTR
jgi:hypothetical protein